MITDHLTQPSAGPTTLAGRYEVDERLGQGGMGVVYRARDVRTGEVCALKLLHAHRTSEAALIGFKREFRAASRLDHPNCLRVLSLEHSDGQWFYTMHYAAGGALDPTQWRRWEDLLPITLQVLAALDHIHSKRIVHRDIKPQNILLEWAKGDSAPRVRLADFGISKIFDMDDGALGEVQGSLAYLAPEQLEGHADPRSDLYALGLLLYETLAGRHPFASVLAPVRKADRGEVLRVCRALRASFVPEPLGNVAPNLPERLAAVVMRLLAIRPQERFATAAGVHDELSRIAESLLPPDRLPHTPPLSRAAYLAAPQFVGRDAEREHLLSFMERVQSGASADTPFVCFISGAAGAGKSRLAGQLLRQAHEAGVRLEVGTWRSEAGGPWPLHGLLRLATESPFGAGAPGKLGSRGIDLVRGDDRNRASTHHEALTANGPTLATLRPTQPPTSPERSGREAVAQWRVYRQVADGLLRQAERQPVLFVLEDAHWADEAALDLLAFLVRSVGQARRGPCPPRVGFVLTHRPNSEKRDLVALQAAAATEGAAISISLGPLSLSGAAEVVSSMLMCDCDPEVVEFTRRIYSHAEGNPLFLCQTLHHLLAVGALARRGEDWDLEASTFTGAQLPASMHQAIGDRAARLSIETKRCLAAAAVLGRQFELDILDSTLKVESALVLDCVDEAIRSEFLTENRLRAGSYQFAHDRVRDAIFQALPEPERMALHAHAASALEARRGKAGETAADLAYHHRGAGNLLEAQTAYEAAATFALASCAFARAADMYQGALEVAGRDGRSPPGELLERHADACLQAGRYESALTSYEARLRTVAGPTHRAEILGRAAEAEYRRGRTRKAGAQLEDVLRMLGFRVPRSRAALRWRTLTALARTLARTWLPTGLEADVSSADRERTRVLAEVLLKAAEIFYFLDGRRGLYVTLAGVHLAERAASPSDFAEGLGMQAMQLRLLGFRRTALANLERAGGQSRTMTSFEEAWHRILRGLCAGCDGNAGLYVDETHKAERLLEESHEPLRVRMSWSLGGEALLALGRVQEAEQNGRKLIRLAEELQDDRGRGWALSLCGWAASRAGEYNRACEVLGEAAASAERAEDHVYRLMMLARRSFALLMSGAIDEGWALAHSAQNEYVERGFLHPSASVDGVLLSAAALKLHRDGRLDIDARWTVWRTRVLRRRLARHARLSGPLFLAGSGAYDVARGRVCRGRALIVRAIALAEANGLRGELHDVHAVAGRVLPGDEGQAHLTAARVLEEQFRPSATRPRGSP